MGPVGNPITKSSQKEVEGGAQQARNSNLVTQHQVKSGGEFGGSAKGATSRQCLDWSPTGFLKETNITRGIHTQYSAVYNVWAVDA